MLFWMIIKVALKSLQANKLRSFLAMLGIIIGVGAVIAMLAIGTGAQKQTLDRITAMGSNLLVLVPGQRGTGGVISGVQQNLTIADSEGILKNVDDIKAVAPSVSKQCQVKHLDLNTLTSVLACTPSYFQVRDFAIDSGRAIGDGDCSRWARVAVLGPTTVRNLFGLADPLGQVVKINGVSFTIIGVTHPKGNRGWSNPDDQVFVPYTTGMHEIMGVTKLREIDIECAENADIDAVQAQVAALMRQLHKLRPDAADDVTIHNQAEYLDMRMASQKTFSMLLLSVACIALLVGGIGIMNIMLVTVTERTREIGIRKAIGAKKSDILMQFLIESIVMSGVGGILGVAIGVASAQIVGLTTTYSTIITSSSIVLSLGFATIVGIFFGFYPATRAAKLDPIDALRYE